MYHKVEVVHGEGQGELKGKMWLQRVPVVQLEDCFGLQN